MDKIKYNKIFGKFGEDLAREYLEKKGFTIVANNYRCISGEIDIIAKNEDLLIIVEVKSRNKIGTEETLLAITKAKQRRISRATADFIEENQQYSEFYIRFDIITINKHSNQNNYVIEHYEDAFTYIFDER